jgi:lipopolysaccharide/colanic/teichoic acid biosynthesis glycosyltransferase
MIRFFDILFSLIGLLLLSPLLIIVYILIVLESEGSGIYTQVRVGFNSNNFKLYKFRSMFTGSDKNGVITIGSNDTRVTKIGRFIRKYKIDELPQLFNVLVGDMSIVGPRPEVPEYVKFYTNEQIRVLGIKPGITDYASIEYANENEILGLAIDPHSTYVNEVLPKKIKLNFKYIDNKSLKEYFIIIVLTFLKIVSKNKVLVK